MTCAGEREGGKGEEGERDRRRERQGERETGGRREGVKEGGREGGRRGGKEGRGITVEQNVTYFSLNNKNRCTASTTTYIHHKTIT